jgi:hypothetical protein
MPRWRVFVYMYTSHPQSFENYSPYPIDVAGFRESTAGNFRGLPRLRLPGWPGIGMGGFTIALLSINLAPRPPAVPPSC